MKLDNHIVHRLLTDDTLWLEIIQTQAEKEGKTLTGENNDVTEYAGMWQLLNSDNNKTFWVTQSVMEHMELFDTKKSMIIDGWKIFKSLPDFKKTFILPLDAGKATSADSLCLRIWKKGSLLYFCYLHFLMDKNGNKRIGKGELRWVLLYVDIDKEMCHHFNSPDGLRLAPFLYSLMCFVELCDNQVVEVAPKAKYGTKKSGKIINVLPFPIIVINNTWNVKTIRTDRFPVRGHVALRWTGAGRSIPKLVYISPYEKEGYTRRSGKEMAG